MHQRGSGRRWAVLARSHTGNYEARGTAGTSTQFWERAEHLFTDGLFCRGTFPPLIPDTGCERSSLPLREAYITLITLTKHVTFAASLPRSHKCKDGNITDYIWEENEMGQVETTAGGLANAVAINTMIGV